MTPKGSQFPKPGPAVWLGQSVNTSSICAGHCELRQAPFLTSLGCAIRRPFLRDNCFGPALRTRLGITGPLMVDSGGFALTTSAGARWTVRHVAALIRRIEADIFVTLDYPPRPSDTDYQRKRRIISSAANFKILSEMFPEKIIMPVIHGRTISEIELSLDLLSNGIAELTWVGLGGMVPLLQHRRVLGEISALGPEVFIARALARIRGRFPQATIHVFGAGGTRTFPAVFALGADSADSIGWRQAAGFGSIFLALKSQRTVKWNSDNGPPRKRLDRADIAQLEMCTCPICRMRPKIASRLRAFRASFYNRSIHNAWTVTNQMAFWPKTRSEMLSLIADGGLGPEWSKAANFSEMSP